MRQPGIFAAAVSEVLSTSFSLLTKHAVNGKECGRGTGKSQKIAKEEAARQAWAAMGW